MIRFQSSTCFLPNRRTNTKDKLCSHTRLHDGNHCIHRVSESKRGIGNAAYKRGEETNDGEAGGAVLVAAAAGGMRRALGRGVLGRRSVGRGGSRWRLGVPAARGRRRGRRRRGRPPPGAPAPPTTLTMSFSLARQLASTPLMKKKAPE